MQKKMITAALLLFAGKLNAQFVGINTNSPQAMLHVKDSNVLFSGPNPFVNYSPASNPPVQGAGTRFMWYAQKAAFRAGWVENNRWDKDSIGPFSIGLGHSVLSAGTASTAMGMRTKATGWTATAMGYATEATGDYSFAAGFESKATAQISVAIGSQNTASGLFSVAMGTGNQSAGGGSITMGQANYVSGTTSVALGSDLRVKARSAVAAGWLNDTSDFPDPTFINPLDRIFQIGNGDGFFGTRKNALTVLRNGNHGIGTLNPIARLQVADSSVLFTGPALLPLASPSDPPAQGSGSRTMWYSPKGAFRAGYVFANQWDKDSIGVFSVALGNSNVAKGEGSFAMGSLSAARGQGSVAMGVRNEANGAASVALGVDAKATGERTFATGDQAVASGNNAIAMGNFVNASGDRGIAMGYVSTAAGFNSTAIGFGAIASGNYSVSIGSNTQANGGVSISMGNNTRANGNYSTAMGHFTKSYSDYSFVIGRFNDTLPANRLFEIGNGTADNARKNAITVLQNGFTGVNTAQPAAMLHVLDSSVVFSAGGQANPSPGVPPISGAGRRMMWYVDRAAFRAGYVSNDQWNRDNVGDYTFAAGYDSKANSIGSVATGISATASGFTSVAMGYLVTASGVYSAAFGYSNTANGYYSLVTGGSSSTSGSYSTAHGEGVTAKAVGSLVFGRYNESSDNPNVFTAAPNDRIFQIGNGNDNTSRSNAITVLRNGNMGLGVLNPARPLSFPPALGEKILLYPGGAGEVGIGVYGNELRLHCDNPGSMVSFGTQDNAGNFTQAGRFQVSGGYALFVNGSIWANGTTYASDERFKQNITPIGSPLEKLLRINGVEYEMKKEAFPQNNFRPGRQMGLLAQNVETVAPEAVQEQNGYKGVDYARLVPLLIEAMKEMEQKRKEDAEKIKQLEKRINELQQQ